MVVKFVESWVVFVSQLVEAPAVVLVGSLEAAAQQAPLGTVVAQLEGYISCRQEVQGHQFQYLVLSDQIPLRRWVLR